MIDLHSHILCDIDDGAKSLNESISLCKKALQNDINIIIATPHFECGQKINPFLKKREREWEILTDRLKNQNIEIEIGLGAEVFLNDEVLYIDDLSPLTINNSRYMLCEFAMGPFNPDLAMIYAEEVVSKGVVPIIAHPERYITFLENPYIINELYDIGALFQVNMDSLAGMRGEMIKYFATDLIANYAADFIATDAHSLNFRSNDIETKKVLFDESITDTILQYCLCDAPLFVVNDKEIKR